MSLDGGLIGLVSFVPLASSLLSDTNTVVLTSSHQKDSSLPVSSALKVYSVPASSVPSATSSGVLSRTASSSDIVKPSKSGAAQMRPASADTESHSRDSLQYLRDRHAQRDVDFAKVDGKNIHREELVTSSRLARRTRNASLPPFVGTVTFCGLLMMMR